MSPIQQMLLGAGGAAADPLYVDDVFSTYLYTGTGSSGKQIVNNIDISNEGGMVWLKNRSSAGSHTILDTVRTNGFDKSLYADTNDSEVSGWSSTANSNGFTLGQGYTNVNGSGETYSSWSFRRAKGFFDVVTFNETGSPHADFTVSHSLGCKPGMIILKRTDGSSDWWVWHKHDPTQLLRLNTSAAQTDMTNDWCIPTSTNFTFRPTYVGAMGAATWVAYLFADGDESAAQIFGENGDKSIIKMGTYTGNGSNDGPTVNTSFEPSYCLIKQTTQASNWRLHDCMRGVTSGFDDAMLRADTNQAEVASGKDRLEFHPTGFKLTNSDTDMNQSGATYAYMCIRRPDGYVGKLPSAGTDVFAMDTGAGSGTIPNFDSGFPVDFAFDKKTNGTSNWDFGARLAEGRYMNGNLSGAEGSWAQNSFKSNVGWNYHSGLDSSVASWMWKRWKGCEVVTYTGNGNSARSIVHSMNNVPEMMWVKRRSNSQGWMVYHKGLNGGTNPAHRYLELNEESAEADDSNVFGDTAPTSTVFTVGNDVAVNNSNDTYIAMLFSSANDVNGNPISKVGYYTGNGSNSGPSITTGFSPRFIIVKAAELDKPWLVFDTLRGIASGSDARLKLDSVDAQNTSTDWLDTTSTGFDIAFDSSNINSSGENYIYYCHA